MARVSPTLVLQARAEARAMLYAANEFDLADAIEPLLRYAVESGVEEELGAAVAFGIIRAAFAGVATI